MGAIPTALGVILMILLATVALAAGLFVLVKLFGLVWVVFSAIFTFIGREISDAVRLIGSVVLAIVFVPLVVLSVIIGRWSASAHYGRALMSEVGAAGQCIYRMLIGNPARLLGLRGAVEGLEQRLPAAIADAPGADKPSRRAGMFEGYKILASLPGGGSGGKLYVAEPEDVKQAALERRGLGTIDRVVIKVFSQREGSTLDQIVRESRALEAARELGLVLEHKSETERFYYVMRYVPGDSLAVVTQRLHAESDSGGLGEKQLGLALAYAGDLLSSLETYHRGGLWHKDVKPDNIIVDAGEGGRAHLVDFGLVTPMRSAMTLTTHGTEYFRDPELVRQALRGVKVHQIDGAKFDVYSAGAVLYSVIENSFPAHGGLSRVSKRCPEALRWIVRRSMAEYDNRYPTARAMLDDLRAVAAARDPFKMRPADLPSMRAGGAPLVGEDQPGLDESGETLAAASPVPPAPATPPASPEPAAPRGRTRPKIRLANWWSGRYTVDGERVEPAAAGMTPAPGVGAPSVDDAVVPMAQRRPASEQLESARRRAQVRRQRAMERIGSRSGSRGAPGLRRQRRKAANHASGMNAGVAVALFLFLAASVGLAGGLISFANMRSERGVLAEAHAEASVSVSEAEAFLATAAPLRARVLMVSDVDYTLIPGDEALYAGAIGAMQQLGVEFVGDVPGRVPGPAGEEDPSLEWIAVARATRGQVPIDDAELPERLLLALRAIQSETGAAAPDALLLLAPEPAGTEGVRYVLVSPGNVTTGPAAVESIPAVVSHLRSATEGI